MKRTAEISECGRYRWWLRRDWSLPGEDQRCVCFVMLNPSTADDKQDDPTLRRCIHFARAWGFNVLSVRNLFPWRATDPRELFRAETVTGGDRGDSELAAAVTADLVILAWGGNVPFGRDQQALKALSSRDLYCIGTTKGGAPKHPLARGLHRVPNDQQPIIFQRGN